LNYEKIPLIIVLYQKLSLDYNFMHLARKIAYNTVVQAAGKIAGTVLGLVAIAMITRYLGQFGFGQYTTIITLLSFFAILADLGLTLVTVQMISRPGIDESRMLGNLLSLRLVSAVILLGLAPLSVFFFPYDPEIKAGVAITSLSFLFIALNQVLVGLFQKHLRMDKVSVAEVSGRIVLLFGVILVIRQDGGLFGIMLVTVFSSFVNFGLHYVFSRSLSRIKLVFDFTVWKDIIVRSWPLALTIVFNLIYLKADTLLLSLIKRPSEIGIIAEVGLYGAAYKVIDVLITFPFMFAGIVLPIMTARWMEKNYDGFAVIMQKSFDLLSVLTIPFVVGAQFLAQDIMVFVAGNDFAPSGPILKILIGAAGFIFLGNIFAHAVIAIDKQKKIIGAYAFTAVTALMGYWLFIPRFSYFGAAWMTIYSEAAIALASLYLVRKYTGFFPVLGRTLKAIMAAGIMALSLLALRISGYDNLLLALSLSVVVYFGSLYVLKGITKEEISELLRKQ